MVVEGRYAKIMGGFSYSFSNATMLAKTYKYVINMLIVVLF
jgi:hypothetical protein